MLDKPDHLLQQSNLLGSVSGGHWLPGFLSTWIFKVFDKVSGEISVFYSLEWSVLWVESCLTGCTQKIMLNSSFSDWPQVGSARIQHWAHCCFISSLVIWKLGCVLYQSLPVIPN